VSFNPADYPKNWKQFSLDIRVMRARLRCECTGECGLHGAGLFQTKARRCVEMDGEKAKWAKGRVMLTVAHLNAKGGPCRCDPVCSIAAHVKAMCQRCHLRYDVDLHRDNATRTRDQKRAELAKRRFK